MVRKQLYITSAHEAELKARAGETGATEADVIRGILDAAFGFGERLTAQQAAIRDDFLRTAADFRQRGRKRGSKVYDRSTIYQRFWVRAGAYLAPVG